MLRRVLTSAIFVLVAGCCFPHSTKSATPVYHEQDFGCQRVVYFLAKSDILASCRYIDGKYVVDVYYHAMGAAETIGALMGAVLAVDVSVNHGRARRLVVYEKGTYAGYVDLGYLKGCLPSGSSASNDEWAMCIRDSVRR